MKSVTSRLLLSIALLGLLLPATGCRPRRAYGDPVTDYAFGLGFDFLPGFGDYGYDDDFYGDEYYDEYYEDEYYEDFYDDDYYDDFYDDDYYDDDYDDDFYDDDYYDDGFDWKKKQSDRVNSKRRLARSK